MMSYLILCIVVSDIDMLRAEPTSESFGITRLGLDHTP